MKTSSWLFMAMLVVGSIAGVAWMLNQSPYGATPSAAKVLNVEPPSFVLCSGHVDLENGITPLAPRQAGLITYVVPENVVITKDDVKKGDVVLLQVDDTLAQLQVAEAKADMESASDLYEQAKRQESQFPLKLEQQKMAIKALESKRRSTEAEHKAKIDLYDKDMRIGPSIRTAMKEAINQIDFLTSVEQSKLKELELTKPALDVQRAKSNMEAKKALVEKAKAALDLYQVKAPSAGTVLRVHAHKGEVFGLNPRVPAIEFRPDGPLLVRAEVLQEWGNYVKEGQAVTIEDDTYQGVHWQGEVTYLSKWYSPKRSVVVEPFSFNDVRTLECLVKITGKEDGLRIGQRVRAKIAVK